MHSCRGFRRITHGADRDAYYHEVSDGIVSSIDGDV